MLEGLEISIIKYSDVKENKEYLRYDAEYYSKKVLNLLQKINSQPHQIIKDGYDVSKLAGFEFTKYFTPANMQSSNHYIALTSKNIQNELLSLEDFVTIDKTIADDNLQRSKIQYEDVILSYTGEYRRSLVMLDKDVKYQLGPNICRIRPQHTEINPYYLSTFLNSKIGQMLLDREKTLTAQPTVAMGRIRKMIIPIIQQNKQEQIAENIKFAHSKRQQADLLYKDAIKLLDNFLSISPYAPTIPTTTEKSLHESFIKTGRIDAEYYQPKYEHIENEIKDSVLGCWHLTDGMIADANYNPESDFLYHYIELSDIGHSGEITGYTEATGDELPTRARRVVQTDDVLLSYLEGSLTSCALIDKSHTGCLCSNGFYVLRDLPIRPEVMLVMLKSDAIQQLLHKGCSGHIMASISKDELKKIAFPKLDDQTQQQIADLISESFALRDEANRLLADARQLVEDTIENA